MEQSILEYENRVVFEEDEKNLERGSDGTVASLLTDISDMKGLKDGVGTMRVSDVVEVHGGLASEMAQ